MRIKCNHCNNEFDETLERCPSCGAENLNVKKKTNNGEPKTIEELKQWFYVKLGYNKDKTHIYIGEDHKEPACFGIFKNKDGDIVVYKNKANGERAIRYQGKDEAYGVNELYQLIGRQAQRNGVDINTGRTYKKTSSSKQTKKTNWVPIILFLLGFFTISILFTWIGNINSFNYKVSKLIKEYNASEISTEKEEIKDKIFNLEKAYNYIYIDPNNYLKQNKNFFKKEILDLASHFEGKTIGNSTDNPEDINTYVNSFLSIDKDERIVPIFSITQPSKDIIEVRQSGHTALHEIDKNDVIDFAKRNKDRLDIYDGSDKINNIENYLNNFYEYSSTDWKHITPVFNITYRDNNSVKIQLTWKYSGRIYHNSDNSSSSYDSDNSSNSSWGSDSGSDWDSGDWDSDWGYNDFNKIYLEVNGYAYKM